MQLKHLALIPDGNRRWARIHKLSAAQGHKVAAEKTLPALLEKAAELKIPYFTFWALSTENFSKRSSMEVNNLLRLMHFFLKSRLADFQKKGVRIKTIGDLSRFPPNLQNLIENAKRQTENNTKITLILALNYGGRDEILRAIKKSKLQNPNVKEVVAKTIDDNLDSADIPDPDLIIRAGGEKRLSGFMLWQSQYSELYFTDCLFPDFGPEEFTEIVNDFSKRQRRFGS